MKNLFFGFTILFIFTAYLNAQDEKLGYIIHLNGDTVKGVFLPGQGDDQIRFCRFKELAGTEFRTYYPMDIKAYYYQGISLFETKKFKLDKKDTVLFTELLLKGKISLYFLRDNGREIGNPERDQFSTIRDAINYILEKEGEEPVLMTNEIVTFNEPGKPLYRKESNQYLGVLSIKTNDCPQMKSRIPYIRFETKSLIKFIQKYNQTMAPEQANKVFETQSTKNVITWGGFLSYNFTNLHFTQTEKSFGNFNLMAISSPAIGLQYTIYNPGINQHFAIHMSTELGKLKTTHTFYYNYPIDQYSYRKISIDYIYLKQSMGVQYCWNAHKIKPVLMAGMVLGYRFADHSDCLNTYGISQTAAKTHTDVPFTHIFYGFYLKTGMDFKVAGMDRFFTRLGIDYTMGSTGAWKNISIMDNYSWSLGYRF